MQERERGREGQRSYRPRGPCVACSVVFNPSLKTASSSCFLFPSFFGIYNTLRFYPFAKLGVTYLVCTAAARCLLLPPLLRRRRSPPPPPPPSSSSSSLRHRSKKLYKKRSPRQRQYGYHHFTSPVVPPSAASRAFIPWYAFIIITKSAEIENITPAS